MKRSSIFWLAAITLVGFFLRFQTLGARSLWLDEAIAWRLACNPPLELIERMRQPFEGSPPLYNLLLSAWMRIMGDSEWALRAPAAAAGVVSVLGMYALASAMVKIDGSTRAGESRPATATLPLLAAAAMALSLLQIYNARQVRMYSMGVALLTWTSWLLLNALFSPNSMKYWFFYVWLALAACYTHALALLAIVSHALFVVVFYTNGITQVFPGRLSPKPVVNDSSRGPEWGPAVAAYVVILAGFLPWIIDFQSKVEESGRTYWMPPPRVEDIFQQLFATFAGPIPILPAVSRWGGVAITTVLLVALVRGLYRKSWMGMYLVIGGVVPIVVIVIHAMISGRSLFQSRYLSFVAIDWFLAILFLVVSLPRPLRRSILVLGAVVWSLLFYLSGWDLIGPRVKPGVRAAMNFIETHRRPDEPVLMQSTPLFFEACYHGRGKFKVMLISDLPDRRLHPLSLYLNDDDLTIWPEAVRGQSRVWWLSCDSPEDQAVFRQPMFGSWTVHASKSFPRDPSWDKPVLVELVEHAP